MSSKQSQLRPPAIQINTGGIDGDDITPQVLGSLVKNAQISLLQQWGGTIGLANKLDCRDLTRGLDPAQVASHRARFGKNELDPPQRLYYWSLIWDGLHDVTILMLIAAAVVSLVLGTTVEANEPGSWVEGVAILVTVVIVLNVQSLTDWNNSRNFVRQQLELENSKRVHIVRNGETIECHPRELVVGDVLRVAIGDVLAADGILIEGSSIKLDESALTGESQLMSKVPFGKHMDKITPFMLSGTNVVAGQGRMLVLAVGCYSLQGRILAVVGGTLSSDGALEYGKALDRPVDSISAPTTPNESPARKLQPNKPPLFSAASPAPLEVIREGSTHLARQTSLDLESLGLEQAVPVRGSRGSSMAQMQRIKSIKGLTLTGASAVRRTKKNRFRRLLDRFCCCCSNNRLEYSTDGGSGGGVTGSSLFGSSLRQLSPTAQQQQPPSSTGDSTTMISPTDDGKNLMQKLDTLALDIGKIGLAIATTVFIVMCASWGVGEFANQRTCGKYSSNVTSCEEHAMYGCVFDDNRKCKRVWNTEIDAVHILQFFLTAVTILVVVVPEGLPLAVTLSLSTSMRRMQQDNNQVKNMESSETMGTATTVCSDKTGTLTQNRMTVMRVALDGNTVFQHDATNNTSVGAVLHSKVPKQITEVFAQAASLVSESTSKATFDPTTQTFTYAGNPTECALLRCVHEMGYSVASIRSSDKFKPLDGSSLDWGVHKLPFSSSRKRMSWIVQHPTNEKGYRMYTKGAPAYIFDSCVSVLHMSGQVDAMDPAMRTKVDAVVEEFQHAAMRTLALAYRDFDDIPPGGWEALVPGSKMDEADDALKAAEQKVTLLAVIGIEDPLRPTIVNAIQTCRRAGVDVRMCTGDALSTAVAISHQCGILRDRDMETGPDGRLRPKKLYAMTGAELDERIHVLDHAKPKVLRRFCDLSTGVVGEAMAPPFKLVKGEKVLDVEAFDVIWPRLRVVARCLPEDKLALVCGLRQSELFRKTEICRELQTRHGITVFPDYQVVAVTGDGTNDAPALKAADVGFAMGIVGTDIAKQACDIILLDDNFSSIVAAIKWGRNVFDSISKFCQFQLTVNMVAVVVACVGAFAYQESPLGAVQMLWVNMIMDSLASLALATEVPSPELLDRAPYGKRRPLLSRVMIFNMFGQAIYQLVVMLVMLFDASWLPDESWQMGGVPQYPAHGVVDEESFSSGASVHWTMVFNTFVLMQLFNEFNSRKLQTVERLRTTWSEWNVFTGITSNPTFLLVVLSTFVGQILIVQFGSVPVNVVPLAISQWVFGFVVGVGGLLWQFVINIALVMTDSTLTWHFREGMAQEVEEEFVPSSTTQKAILANRVEGG